MKRYRTPYTYLIGWSKHDKYYYGVRYSKGCNPSDLWTTYFTSSKSVKTFIKQFGDPDIIEIRKVFYSQEQARLWEHKVLKRLKVTSSDKWLNKTDNISFNNLPKTYQHKKKLSNTTKNYFKKNGHPKGMLGKKHSKTTKEKMSKTRSLKQMNNIFELYYQYRGL